MESFEPDRHRLREMALAHFEQDVAAAVRGALSEYGLGRLHGMLLAFVMSGVIERGEFDAYHDRLEEVGKSSRLTLPDRISDG